MSSTLRFRTILRECIIFGGVFKWCRSRCNVDHRRPQKRARPLMARDSAGMVEEECQSRLEERNYTVLR